MRKTNRYYFSYFRYVSKNVEAETLEAATLKYMRLDKLIGSVLEPRNKVTGSKGLLTADKR